jgi:hypothetical protein
MHMTSMVLVESQVVGTLGPIALSVTPTSDVSDYGDMNTRVYRREEPRAVEAPTPSVRSWYGNKQVQSG